MLRRQRRVQGLEVRDPVWFGLGLLRPTIFLVCSERLQANFGACACLKTRGEPEINICVYGILTLDLRWSPKTMKRNPQRMWLHLQTL